MGVPACDVMGVIEVEGRLGIIMECIQGASMQKIIQASPMKSVTLITMLSELHARVHAILVSDLPSQRQHMERQIRTALVLSEDVKKKVLCALAQLPDGHALCHGDFHPDNVVMTSKGPVIIDWFNATQGNPLADVAHTRLLIQFGVPEGKPLSRFLQWRRRWFQWFYVRRYVQLRPGSRQEIAAWELPALAAQLNDFMPQEQVLVLARIKQLLLHSETRFLVMGMAL